MKKFYFLIALFIFSGTIAKSQCTVDTANMQLGFSPVDTFLPPIINGIVYDTFIQAFVPAYVNDTTDTLRILSTRIDTILGFPAGISYTRNPASSTIGSGGRQCIQFSGSTLATPGIYPLTFFGSVHVISAALGDTVLNLPDFGSVLETNYSYTAPFQYYLEVQSPFIRSCTIDTSLLSTTGVYPVPSYLPCIVRTVPYDQTVQGKIQVDSTLTIAGISVIVKVDSIELDSIHGLPNGITFGRSPRVLLGGGYGCVNFAGTTTDTTGTYPLTAFGTAWLTASAAGQTFPNVRRGNLNQYSAFGGYYLRVVNAGDSCSLTIPSGINNYYSSINAEVSVFPNPNNGVFALKINAAAPVAGQLSVYDVLGRKVYEKPLDIAGVYTTTLNLSSFGSGLYTLQVSTPQGSAIKKISVE